MLKLKHGTGFSPTQRTTPVNDYNSYNWIYRVVHYNNLNNCGSERFPGLVAGFSSASFNWSPFRGIPLVLRPATVQRLQCTTRNPLRQTTPTYHSISCHFPHPGDTTYPRWRDKGTYHYWAHGIHSPLAPKAFPRGYGADNETVQRYES